VEKNWNAVRENALKYKNEFKPKIKNFEAYRPGEKVLIRNEHKCGKMDDDFSENGVVERKLYGDVYAVRNEKGLTIKRHVSQLKRLKDGEVGL
jgi:hypothetical protein